MSKPSLFSYVVPIALLAATTIFSQESFYYSRDTKIAISPSKTKVAVIRKKTYTATQVKEWLKRGTIIKKFGLKLVDVDSRLSIASLTQDTLGTLIKTLRENGNLQMVTPVYQTDEGQELTPTDEILVQFKSEMNEKNMRTLIQQHKLEITRTKKGVKNYYRFRVSPAG